MALTVLLGGARSGKSALAVDLAARTDTPVTVIATGQGRDEEMAARIERHRRDRPPSWGTVEEPVDLASAIRTVPEDHAVIVDCLTLWTANVLDGDRTDDQVVDEAVTAARLAADRPGPTFAVTNEVGMGIVPFEPGTRRYRDLLGRVNAAWCDAAETALLLVAGRAIPLSPPGALLDG